MTKENTEKTGKTKIKIPTKNRVAQQKEKTKIAFKKDKLGVDKGQLTNKLQKMEFIGQLYPFQKKVLDWSKKNNKGIIGIDMGLGKTVITISIICEQKYGKTIIILPLQLIEQWQLSIKKFSNITEVGIYHGSNRNLMDFDKYRIILTTYDIVRLDMEDDLSLLNRSRTFFDCIILDEAHKIRNNETRTYRSCNLLGTNCASKWLLTGTVIHNNFEDFMSLACFLETEGFDRSDFNLQDLLQHWKNEYYYVLKKKDCVLSLPQKNITEHVLEFDDDHNSVYLETFNEVKEVYSDYLSNSTRMNFSHLLVKILRLRQCCNHPDSMLNDQLYGLGKNLHKNSYSAKFKKTVEIIQKTPYDDKILIFSQWSHSLSVLGKYLSENKIDYLQYNGSINIDKKNEILKVFREGNCKILLITITAGGVGLDLNFANHVIIMDSWWNPALEEQAIDRVYRIGQNKPVEIHRLYMKKTIEFWMIGMKKEKSLVDSKFHEDSIIYKTDKHLLKKLLSKYI